MCFGLVFNAFISFVNKQDSIETVALFFISFTYTCK